MLPYLLPIPQMPPKKKPLPLHVSMHRIQEERRNVERRTKLRIAQLHASENSEIDSESEGESELKYGSHVDKKDRQIEEWHCCLNIFCFCLTVLTFNLLFLQWLYIQVSIKV
jgi:hypothetical protein